MKSHLQFWPKDYNEGTTFAPYLMLNNEKWPGDITARRQQTLKEDAYITAATEMFERIYIHIGKQSREYIFLLE